MDVRNDFVVGLVAARLGANYYIVDRVKGQWDFTETCRQLVALKQRYPQTQRIYIEDAANGPAIVNVLRGQVPGIIPVTPQGARKRARKRPRCLWRPGTCGSRIRDRMAV